MAVLSVVLQMLGDLLVMQFKKNEETFEKMVEEKEGIESGTSQPLRP